MFWKRLVDLGNREGVKLPVPRRFKMAGFRWPQMAGFDLAPEGGCTMIVTSRYVRVTLSGSWEGDSVTKYKWHNGMWMTEEWMAKWAP
jgi:hypothetical protein